MKRIDIFVTAKFEHEGKTFEKGVKIDSRLFDAETLSIFYDENGKIGKPVHALMKAIAREVIRITGEK